MIDMVEAVSANGAFPIRLGVRRGDFNVDVLGLWPDMYVKEIRRGARDVLNEGLYIAPTESDLSAMTLDVVIAMGAGAIDGSMLNSKDAPVANAVVALVPVPAQRHRADLFRATTTDEAGEFSLSGIPPGDYKLFAWNYANPGSWQAPDFLRRYESDGVPVHVEPKATQNHRLRVIPERR
jgi:hypothetical protein